MRSTFCFPASIQQYKSIAEIQTSKYQWNTFERIENFNAEVLSTLGNTVPQEINNSLVTPAFYQFPSSDEKTAYKMGQLAHTVVYPNNNSFQVPYASRPIPYTSSVLSTIHSFTPISTITSTFCTNFQPGAPTIDADSLLQNRVGINLYIRVSTQISQYPKSPYKFASGSEYIKYIQYKNLFE